MELIQQLISRLGVNEGQAKGGAGLIFKLAQEKLNSGEFQQLANAIPGITGLMNSAPEPGAEGGLMGSIGSAAANFGGLGGKKMESLGNLSQLAGGFSQLGLSADMVGRFLPIVLSFVQSQGGDSLKGLLEKVLQPSSSST
jgi:hypothetical protein